MLPSDATVAMCVHVYQSFACILGFLLFYFMVLLLRLNFPTGNNKVDLNLKWNHRPGTIQTI